MKIAILNFPLDSNYGGMLQRYALIHVLQKLGHEPTHLFTKIYFQKPSFIEILKRVLYSLIHFKIPSNLNPGKKEQANYEYEIKNILPFYNKYIPHTAPIDSPKKLFSYKDFDAFLVGSDQVWRRSMSSKFPFESMFFNWIQKANTIKIAYGISFGLNHHEIPEAELTNLSKLYESFSAVSVRESSAIDILSSLNWTRPKAELVLDPTLLLDKEEYLKLIANGNTEPSKGNLFCYLLDSSETATKVVQEKALENALHPFYWGIGTNKTCSIEQWLRSFVDAEYVITDSFHGSIFSIIFNKPFTLVLNERRGMARFESLFNLLKIKETQQLFDWDSVNSKLNEFRQKSLCFLKQALTPIEKR